MANVTGGTKLGTVLAQIGSKLGEGPVVKIGFLAGATYPDGTSVALVAAVNEFGRPSRGQPPRPFFRNMIADKQASWPAAIATQLRANDYDGPRTLGVVGAGIRGQLQQSIVSLTEPPLAPSTIRRKGSAKPLIDTGHMLNSVDYEVTE